MLKGPEAAEFTLGEKPNYGNFVTYLEVQIFNVYFFIQDPNF